MLMDGDNTLTVLLLARQGAQSTTSLELLQFDTLMQHHNCQRQPALNILLRHRSVEAREEAGVVHHHALQSLYILWHVCHLLPVR